MMNDKMKVAICAIAKFEDEYMAEWIDYHLQIGVDVIYLYDNNDDASLMPIVGKYIKDGKLVLLDVRNMPAMQMSAYQHFVKKYSRNFDWSAFIDCDEFITLGKKYRDIKDYLHSIPEVFNVVHLSWMGFGDSGLTIKTEGGVLDRFTNPCPYDFKCWDIFPENNKTKSIVRDGHRISWKFTPHTPNGPSVKVCNGDGIEITNSPFSDYTFENAYVRHYYSKSLEEWIYTKQKRGRADVRQNYYGFERYCAYNPDMNIEKGLKEIIQHSFGEIILVVKMVRQSASDIEQLLSSLGSGSVLPDKIMLQDDTVGRKGVSELLLTYFRDKGVVVESTEDYNCEQKLFEEAVRGNQYRVVISVKDIHAFTNDSIKTCLVSHIGGKNKTSFFEIKQQEEKKNGSLLWNMKQIVLNIVLKYIRKYTWMRFWVVQIKSWQIKEIKPDMA